MSEPRASSSSAAETECRCFTTVAHRHSVHLANTLRCLSKLSNLLSEYEAVLHVPGRGDIRLKRDMHDEQRWITRWESEPQIGPLFKQLPAAVRQVIESKCQCVRGSGGSVLDFWLGLGATLKYDFVKQGNVYFCNHNGYDIICSLFQIASMVKPGDPSGGYDAKQSG